MLIMGTTVGGDRAATLLFPAVRREILVLLLGRPDERFYLREILRTVGAGSGAVQRELKQLVDAGLVHREEEGHHVYFSADRNAAIFPELQSIIVKTAGAAGVLRAGLTPFLGGGIELALIHGSVASGKQTARSDVDLLVVGEVTLAELLPALRAAEARLGREVNSSVYPVREFRDKLKRGAPFLRSILAGPKLFVTGDQRDLDRVAR